MSDATQAAAPSSAPAPAASAPAASAPAAAPATAPAAAPAPAAPAASPAASPAPAAAAPAPAADDKGGKPDQPAGAPESYADFTLPEGIEADVIGVGEFKAVAKELNLTQEAAQKLVTFNTSRIQEQAKQTLAGWEAAAKSDKEFGGDKFDANLAVAKTALDRFATPEFNAYLNKTGLGSNPEFIRTMFRVGKAISEDGFVPGKSGNSSGKSIAQQMYPNMNP